jgi:NDP-sugar pyrophosphorylase family protein
MPVVDEGGKVVYVLCLNEFNDDTDELVAVVMAGGEGQRLKPLTDKIPKPMLKVGDKPILQIILESLRNSGFKRIVLNIRYLGHIIEDYFQDGSAFNLDIKYIHEPKPLGTAGGLGLIPEELRPNSPFLIINGDLLTTLNFEAFREFHIAAKYDFTLCGRPYEVQVPFGYPVINGDLVTEFREKPSFIHLVNSGIYCVAPDLIDEVPSREYFDMPDLIRKAIERKRRVGVFPLREKFHEIGRQESYEDAEEFYQNHFCQKDVQNEK